MGMVEIEDPSRSYSWSNNQRCPIMTTLDKILALVESDMKYPLARVVMFPKGVSNHNPLLIDLGGLDQTKELLFRFKKLWLEIEGFAEIMKNTWQTE
jgi:hypothetical protein